MLQFLLISAHDDSESNLISRHVKCPDREKIEYPWSYSVEYLVKYFEGVQFYIFPTVRDTLLLQIFRQYSVVPPNALE